MGTRKGKKRGFLRGEVVKEERVRRHFRELGCSDEDEYKQWCRTHGFKPSLEKKQAHLRKEKALLKSQRAAATLAEAKAKSKREKRSRQRASIGHSGLNEIYRRTKIDARALKRFLNYQPLWIRPPAHWRPKFHNADRQLSSLVRYVFAQYPVPSFLDRCWLEEGQEAEKHREWFIHIGQGKNIRTANGLPFPLTKKQAHYFLEAPSNMTPEEAIQWGQIVSLGGTPFLARAIINAEVDMIPSRQKFWLSVFKFFVDNPMLDLAHVKPVIDFIKHQKYEANRVFVAQGRLENQGPPRPNFTMRGRNADALLRQVEQWHARLGKSKKSGPVKFWETTDIRPFEMMTGKEGKNLTIWTIKELNNQNDLQREGRELKHCVASYYHSCSTGQCSIWSLSRETFEGKKKILTIEVRNRSRQIVQIRGKCNRLATQKEKSIISQWAVKQGLSLSRYITGGY